MNECPTNSGPYQRRPTPNPDISIPPWTRFLTKRSEPVFVVRVPGDMKETSFEKSSHLLSLQESELKYWTFLWP